MPLNDKILKYLKLLRINNKKDETFKKIKIPKSYSPKSNMLKQNASNEHQDSKINM
jgi:hypothetical protein